MNYLAHLFLSDGAPESLIGNLLGDFVKGSIESIYSKEIIKGIYLHRKIDSYTDSHRIFRSSKRLIGIGRSRFSGIMIDVFYDHFLAQNWSNYSTISLKDVFKLHCHNKVNYYRLKSIMSNLQTKIPTDTWVAASWDEYIQIIENPAYEKAKGYYYNGRMRIEMSALGNDHSLDHALIILAASNYAAIKGIPMNGRDNCTYRKTGFKEAQPDVSYYIGDNADVIPYGTTIITLDDFPPPNLVIEVANTSLADDKGEKRLLYEELGVDEYWIVDVKNVRIIAFLIENQGSRRIAQSQVLPGLNISILEEAFRRSRQMNHSQVISWLLSEFQK